MINSTSTRERNILADALRHSGPVWHTFAAHASSGGMRINPGDRLLLVAYGLKLKVFRTVQGQRDRYPESTPSPIPNPTRRLLTPEPSRISATLSFRGGKTRHVGEPTEAWPTPEPDPSIKPPWED